MGNKSPFIWGSRIQFMDTDASGHIHYIGFLHHIETAEHEFMRCLGFPFKDIETEKFSYPKVHMECDYIARLVYDDPIEIEAFVSNVGTKSFTLFYYVRKGASIAAKSTITNVCVNRTTRISCPIPKDLKSALEVSYRSNGK